jgi:lipid-A-disaccharide synthase
VLPFEEKYFTERGVHGVYVGHPMFDVPVEEGRLLDPPLPTGSPRVALFPGSRRAEIDKHMPAMLRVVSEIRGRFRRASFVAAAPSEERAWQIRHHLRSANTPVDIRVGHGDAIIAWADLVLTKSGTATLQVARQGRPMVVMFAVPWWQWMVARWLILTPYMALVNILAGREVVPEFIPFHGSALPVARECLELLTKEGLRKAMVEELKAVVGPLLPKEGKLAADRVAEEVGRLVKVEGTMINDQ